MTIDIALLQTQLQEAEAFAAAEQYLDAIQACSNILDAIPATETNPTKRQLRLDTLQARGDALGQCNMPKVAIADYEQWRAESEPSVAAVGVLVKIAGRYGFLGEQQKAIQFYQEALDQPFELTPQQKASIHSGMGDSYRYVGHLLEADIHHEQAIALLRLTDDRRTLADALNSYAGVLKHQGKLDKSIASYKEALQLNREMNAVFHTATVLNNLGEVYQRFFDMEQAYHYHQEALNLLTDDIKSRHPYLLCDLYRNMGVVLCRRNKVEEGIEYLQRAQQLNTTSNTPHLTMQLHISFGVVELMRGNIAAAQERIEQCIALAEEKKVRTHHAQALYILGLCQQAQGEAVKAKQTWQQAVYLAHETDQRMVLWRTHIALADNASNPEIRDVHRRIAVDIIHQVAAAISDEALRQVFLNIPLIQATLKTREE
jgi:tetratricopeptide (TPR) repeat protein